MLDFTEDLLEPHKTHIENVTAKLMVQSFDDVKRKFGLCLLAEKLLEFVEVFIFKPFCTTQI